MGSSRGAGLHRKHNYCFRPAYERTRVQSPRSSRMIFSAFTGSLALCSGFSATTSKILSSGNARRRDRRCLSWTHFFSDSGFVAYRNFRFVHCNRRRRDFSHAFRHRPPVKIVIPSHCSSGCAPQARCEVQDQGCGALRIRITTFHHRDTEPQRKSKKKALFFSVSPCLVADFIAGTARRCVSAALTTCRARGAQLPLRVSEPRRLRCAR